MTTNPADSGSPKLPPLRLVSEVRAALVMGYGFPGDADDFDAEFNRAVNHSDGIDFTAAAKVVDDYRGRILAKHDPEWETSIAAALAEIEAAREAAQ
ncbi:hypothetical protein ACIRU3_07105 [Streptomyces sp. NPDC101151]|uniref:hypothetical protein n=1 Tax=Streptomyces sp. NPDC101151 TaxID=3366115 RepID=UPI003800BB6A